MEKYTCEEEEPKTSSQKLQEKFRILEKDYEVFSKSSFKNKPKKSLHNFQKLVLDDSPRYLMSSLQDPTTTRRSSSFCYCSPVTFTGSNSGEVWRVRTNELAKEEVRRERKLAFESGKLRGRRLFEKECEVGSENDDDDDEILSVLPEVINVEKGELSSCLANKYDGYYHAWGDVEEEVVVKEVMNEEEKDVIEDQSKSNGVIRVFGDGSFGGKTRVLKIFLAFALICFVLGNYVGFDGQGSDIQVHILPT